MQDHALDLFDFNLILRRGRFDLRVPESMKGEARLEDLPIPAGENILVGGPR